MMKWNIVKLVDLVEKFSIREKDYKYSGKLEFLGVNNETGIGVSKYASEDKISEYKIIEKGCFVYNPYRINVGSIGYQKENKVGLISPAYVIFKVKPKTIIPDLLLAFLKSKEGLRQINLYARGTVRKALRFEDLCNIEINIPEYEFQILLFDTHRKIESKTRKLSKEIALQDELLNLLRKSILGEAIRGKLVPQNSNDKPVSELLKKIKAEKLKKEGDLKKEKQSLQINPGEVPFNIPKNWIWCRLGEISTINGRIGWKGLKAEEYKNDGPLFLSVHSLNYGVFVDFSKAYHITKERYDESPEIMLKDNDILLCKDGAGIGKLGIISNLKKEATVNSSLLVIRLFEMLNPKYVYYCLCSNYFKKIVASRIMGATTPHLYQRDIINFYVPIPPIKEQDRIVKKIEDLFLICDNLKNSLIVSHDYTKNIQFGLLKSF